MDTLKRRKLNRLNGYDYAEVGVYFITICTKNRECLFGDVINREIVLNEFGKIVENGINNIKCHYENVDVDSHIIMPNHLHLIISINPTERINPFPTVDIPNIIGKFKAGVTRNIGNAFMRSDMGGIWQKSYHDHIIRNEKDYFRIKEYIQNNPSSWQNDCHNPTNDKYKQWSEK